MKSIQSKVIGSLLMSLVALSQAFAVIGDYIPEAALPKSVCLLSIGNNLCSGTLITRNKIVTANHCFKEEDLSGARVQCGSQTTRILRKKLTDKVNDLAFVITEDPIKDINPMPVVSDELLGYLKDSTIKRHSPLNCAIFGYGLDNDQNVGILHGVYSVASEISWDFPYKNSINFLKELKKLEQQYRKNNNVAEQKIVEMIIEIESISVVYGAAARESMLDDILLKYGVPKIALASYYDVVIIALAPQILAGYEEFKRVHPDSTYLKTYSFNNVNRFGNSGMVPGDSGGAFACKAYTKDGPQWVLFAVNSYIESKHNSAVNKFSNIAFHGSARTYGFASLLTPTKRSLLEISSEIVQLDPHTVPSIEPSSYRQPIPLVPEVPRDVLRPVSVY